MHITAHLDIDLVALDAADTLTCLVDLTAPVPDTTQQRLGQSLVVVLDRSGSMAGEPLEGAKQAIASLIHRLAPQDSFGLVTFDDTADVVIPLRSMADHDLGTLTTLIGRIDDGGSTDLSSGYLLALREIKRGLATPQAGATVLLISDGEANAGITDPVRMRDLAGQAFTKYAITTSTLGQGPGYEEVFLEAMTRGGNGTHAFAPDEDSAVHEIQNVVNDLLDKSIAAVLMRIYPQHGLVASITVLQDLPHWADGDAVVINLGDLFAGEQRKTLFTLGIPAIHSLGPASVADVVFEYTTFPDLLEHTVTVPLLVNVVPQDQASARVPDPVFEVEQLLADIDSRKRGIATSLRSGELTTGRRTLVGAITTLNAAREHLKQTTTLASLRSRLDDAAHDLLRLADVVINRDANQAGKSVMDSYAATSRGRQFRGRPNPTTLDNDDAT